MNTKLQKRTLKYVQELLDELSSSSCTFQALYQFLKKHYSRQKCAIYFDEDGKLKSQRYKDFFIQAEELGSRMCNLFGSISSSSPIALKYRNSPEWPALFYAILMSGHDVLLLDARLPKENTENLLQQTKAGAIISNEAEPYSIPSYRLLDLKKSERVEPKVWGNHVMFCSSGTTGAAKVMVYDGKAIVGQVNSAYDIPHSTVDIIYEGKLRNFAMIPFHHIFGFVAVFLWYTTLGKTLVYPSSNATKDLLYAIKKGKCDHVYSVPLLWDGVAQTVNRTFAMKSEKMQKLLEKMVAYNCNEISKKEAGIAANKIFQNIVKNKILGTSPIYCITGGGYISRDTLHLINGLGYPLYNGYGMTEIGVTSVELSPRVEDRLLGSIGKPFHGVTYQLKNGELYVKCASMHIGSIIGGAREDFDRDSFFATGDVAEEIDGRYYIRGRLKDVIIDNDGENVYPDEIENYFKDVTYIRNSVAFGVSNGHKENIVLVVELAEQLEGDALKKLGEELQNVNNKLVGSRKVSEFAIYPKALPLANSMKVKRGQVKEEYINSPDSFLYFDKKRRAQTAVDVSFEGYDKGKVEQVLNLVRKAFASNLSLPLSQINDDAIWNTDLGGDSMSYVSMVADLDEEFHIEIPQEEYGKVGTVNGFALLILRLLDQR